MPSRFSQKFETQELKDKYNIYNLDKISNYFYEKKVGDRIIVLSNENNKEFKLYKFGWKRKWSDKLIINARRETVSKNMFSEAFNSRRCIVPVSQFYEWFDGEKYRIWLDSYDIISFAAIWEEDEGEKFLVLLTQDSEGKLKEIHERMPVLFTSLYEENLWLNEGKILDNSLRKKLIVKKESEIVEKGLNRFF